MVFWKSSLEVSLPLCSAGLEHRAIVKTKTEITKLVEQTAKLMQNFQALSFKCIDSCNSKDKTRIRKERGERILSQSPLLLKLYILEALDLKVGWQKDLTKDYHWCALLDLRSRMLLARQGT